VAVDEVERAGHRRDRDLEVTVAIQITEHRVGGDRPIEGQRKAWQRRPVAVQHMQAFVAGTDDDIDDGVLV